MPCPSSRTNRTRLVLRFGGYGYKEQRELAWKRDREAANRGGRGGGRGGRGGPRGERGNQGGGDRREFGGDRN